MRCRYYITLGAALWASSLQAKPSLLKQAIQAFEKDDFAQAHILIDQATDQTTASGQAWYYRGAIYEKLLRDQITGEKAPELLETTLAAYRQALALIPAPSQYHSFVQINLENLWAYYVDRGRRYYRQENFDKALEQWQYCRQIKADEPCVTLYTAIAEHQAEQHTAAHEHYTQYLAQAPIAPAAVCRALAHLQAELQKDPHQGLQVLAEALEKYPFDHDLLYERLALYQMLKRVEALKELLEQKVTAAPHEASSYYQLGYWYEHQGQLANALQQYQKAAELAPDKLVPLRQQGLVHYNQAAMLTQKIQEMPDETFQEQGAELKKELTHMLEQALPYLEQARRLQPRDTVTLRHLQILYMRLRKPAKAAKIAQKLLQYGL